MLWLELNNSESQEPSRIRDSKDTEVGVQFLHSWSTIVTYHSARKKATFRLMKFDHLNPFKMIFANLFPHIPSLSGHQPPHPETRLIFLEQTKKRQVPCQCGFEAWQWWKPPCGAPCGCLFLYIPKLSVTRCSSIALAENGCSKGSRKWQKYIDLENW